MLKWQAPSTQQQKTADLVGILSLLAIYTFFLSTSWRNWLDPLIDAGHQLYVPWRLSQGAVLFRDADWWYGPLSVYFNALLFRIFGPGMMVLVTANLIIHALIVILAYRALRLAFGPLAAWSAIAVFLCVFSFTRLNTIGNYNYAFPYSHEATHGMLLALAMLLVANRWARRRSVALALAMGTCAGLACLLKPEWMLVAAVLTMATLAIRTRARIPFAFREMILFLLAAVLPMAMFTGLFACSFSWPQAMAYAANAWWPLVSGGSGVTSSPLQQHFMGLDHPWQNAVRELRAGAAALFVLASLYAAGWSFSSPRWGIRLLAATLACAAVTAVLLPIDWRYVGYCLPLLLIIVTTILATHFWRQLRKTGAPDASLCMALLLSLFACTLLARMPLGARVFHFGFIQAAMAAMVIAAAMTGDRFVAFIPTAAGRIFARVASLFILAFACISISITSYDLQASIVQPVGSGSDLFFGLQEDVDPTAALVQRAVTELNSLPPDASILVLPEGVMINYLTRHRSPVAQLIIAFSPEQVAAGREQQLIDQLRRDPPARVVVISRDMREHGVTGYGNPGQPGHALIEWLAHDYRIDGAWGGDPLAPGSHGLAILRPK